MARHVLAFDLDGTLVDHLGDVNLASSRSVKAGCIPDRRACVRVHALVEAGHEVHVISGRGQLLRNVTRQQLRDWVHPKVALLPFMHLQAYWEDYVAMRRWKAQVLRDIGAEIYVGDHDADALAADDAEIPFMHARDFRLGSDLLTLCGELPGAGGQGLALVHDEGALPGRDVAALELGGVPVQEQARGLRVRAPATGRVQEAKPASKGVACDQEAVRGVHGLQSKARAKAATAGGR